MPAKLTHNAIPSILAGDVDAEPLLQVLDIKPVGSSQERYCFVLSDAVSTHQAMLATHLNDLVKTRRVLKGSVIQLLYYICSVDRNRKTIVLLNFETVKLDCETIGNPKMLVESGPAPPISEPTRNTGNATVSKMPVKLTHNAILSILAGDRNAKPLLKVLNIIPPGRYQERYHFLLSDAVSKHKAMLATQLDDLVETGRVRKGSVIQLIDYQLVKNDKTIFVLKLQVQDRETIGNSKMLVESGPAPPEPEPARNTGNATMTPPISSNMNMHSSPNSVSSFGPTIQAPYQAPPPVYKNHGANVQNEARARIIPIAALNPFVGRWAIKARVTAKGDLRRYNNARGEEKVFSFDLLDSEGGEIRAICLNAVVDRFYEHIEVGKVYLISKGSLKPVQRSFNHLKNKWELFLETTSTVEVCPDEDGSGKVNDLSGKSIGTLSSTQLFINPESPVAHNSRAWFDRGGKNVASLSISRDITPGKVNDLSGKSIGTLSSTQLFINPESPVAHNSRAWFDRGGKNVASLSVSKDITPGKVNDLSGKSIGTLSSTQLFINPESPVAHNSRAWFDRGGKNVASLSVSKDITPGGSSRNEEEAFHLHSRIMEMAIGLEKEKVASLEAVEQQKLQQQQQE